MSKVNTYLEEYSSSHQNKINKRIHWVCVPLIFSTVVGFLSTFSIANFLSFAASEPTFLQKNLLNVGFLFISLGWIFYFRLSKTLSAGMFFFTMINYFSAIYLEKSVTQFRLWCLLIFALAWIGQFVGHAIEGKKPSFFKDLQFLLIGPIWLLNFLYKKVGIPS